MPRYLQFNLRQLLLLCAVAALFASGILGKYVSLGHVPVVVALALVLFDLLGDARRRPTPQRSDSRHDA